MKHRKMISETVGYNLTEVCNTFCDQTENLSGFCPDFCYIDCPSSCYNSAPPRVTITTVHHKSQKLHESLIISLTLVGLACFVYCIFMVYKHFKNKLRRRPLQEEIHVHDHDRFVDEEHGPVLDHPIWYIRTVGLQRSTINLITVVKYKKGEGLVEGTDCSVCLSEFEDDDTLRLLPKCNHAFHLPCIDTWLGSHTNCPMCRAPIVSTPNGTLAPVLEPRVVVPQENVERDRGNESWEQKDIGSSQNVVQTMRRSVSVDSLAASRLSSDMANAQLGEINTKIVPKRPDISQGVLHREIVLMKRSFSCGGKVLFPRHNRDRNSVLPP